MLTRTNPYEQSVLSSSPMGRTGIDRRKLLAAMAWTSALWTTPGLFAEAIDESERAGDLIVTPRQTEGPFYPRPLPLDTDNDLIVINDAITPAVGTITHLTGRVMGRNGSPVSGALVEIWQADNNGVYLHNGSANGGSRDQHFQGFGRFLTGRAGEYYFRTIRPVPYPGRTPHIHVKVKMGNRELLTTQLYIKGEQRNERDGVLRHIRDARARESVMVDFRPIPESKIGEVSARFDIILGRTPEAA